MYDIRATITTKRTSIAPLRWIRWPEGCLPDAEHLRSFSGDRDLGFAHETPDVSDGSDGGRHEPRQAEQRADEDEEGKDEQVKVIAMTFLKNGINEKKKCAISLLKCVTIQVLSLSLSPKYDFHSPRNFR